MKASLETMVPLQGPPTWLWGLTKLSARSTVSAPPHYLWKCCQPHLACLMGTPTVKAFWNFKAVTITQELPFLRTYSGSGAWHTLFDS